MCAQEKNVQDPRKKCVKRKKLHNKDYDTDDFSEYWRHKTNPQKAYNDQMLLVGIVER